MNLLACGNPRLLEEGKYMALSTAVSWVACGLSYQPEVLYLWLCWPVLQGIHDLRPLHQLFLTRLQRTS